MLLKLQRRDVRPHHYDLVKKIRLIGHIHGFCFLDGALAQNIDTGKLFKHPFGAGDVPFAVA